VLFSSYVSNLTALSHALLIALYSKFAAFLDRLPTIIPAITNVCCFPTVKNVERVTMNTVRHACRCQYLKLKTFKSMRKFVLFHVKIRKIPRIQFTCLFVKLLWNTICPPQMEFLRFTWSIDIGHFDYHVTDHKTIGFRCPVNTRCNVIIHLKGQSVNKNAWWVHVKNLKNHDIWLHWLHNRLATWIFKTINQAQLWSQVIRLFKFNLSSLPLVFSSSFPTVMIASQLTTFCN
jgi:hypothetical protein